MPNSVTFDVQFEGYVRKDREGRWLSSCPALDLHAQGPTKEHATAALRKTVQLWFENCIGRGTLIEAFKELGLEPVPTREPGLVDARPKRRTRLGMAFPIELSIPAYQTVQLSSSPRHAAG